MFWPLFVGLSGGGVEVWGGLGVIVVLSLFFECLYFLALFI